MAKEKLIAMVYVQNRDYTTIRIPKIVVGMEGEGKSVYKTFDFPYARKDAAGNVVHRGYTPISEVEYGMILEQSKMFKAYIDKGTLVKYDKAPDEAMSEVEKIAYLNTTITHLEGEIAKAATAGKELGRDEATAEFKAENDTLKAEVAALRADNEKIVAEFEAYKKSKKATAAPMGE